MNNDELRIGLIGAGIFVRDAHMPAWGTLSGRARPVAIWSRTRESAAARAAELTGVMEVEESIDSLLARKDIDALDIVLPIGAQAEIVERAIAAGKHVVSEKPIAHDVSTARATIERWRGSGLVWMVAENWRYEESFVRAAALLREGAIGEPLTATWTLHLPMTPDIKYYHTPWRRAGQFKGGFIVDGGVHHVAVLRMVMGEIEAVKAASAHYREDLPAPDTLASTLEFASGALGHYFVSYAARPAWGSPLMVVGREGSLRVDRGWVEIARGDDTVRHEVKGHGGVAGELAAFVKAVREGEPHRNTPWEALRDLAVIEAMLESARGEAVRVVSVDDD